jgi:hypothetical protein
MLLASLRGFFSLGLPSLFVESVREQVAVVLLLERISSAWTLLSES